MALKLIIALVNDDLRDQVLHAARSAGATGSTVINNARGAGLKPQKTFFGLDLVSQSDVLLFLVEASIARKVLDTINEVGHFDTTSGTGMAFQIDVEDAVGVAGQLAAGSKPC
ncbi:MAG: P-II family nitrogen regulator [Pseudohongiella sp.]|nr:P-II family nitrogen regulator [Pseudohongiella sp.]MDO9520304.1 P-II family nitrogen regulator [Pseudohongiella sp.]